MKSILFVLTLQVLEILANGNESSIEARDIFISKDDAFKAKITNTLEDFRNSSDKVNESFINSAIVSSIDVNCMLNEYKKFNLTDKINTENVTDDSEMTFLKIIFWDVAAICSSKTDKLLEFAFENLMTLNILWKSFNDDTELKVYKDLFTCVNNFSIANGYWDNEVYPVTHDMSNETAQLCTEWISSWAFIDFVIDGITLQVFNRSCSTSIYKQTELLVMKTVLLVQVELKEPEKIKEKTKFLENTHKVMEEILTCSALPTDAVRNAFGELIESAVGQIIHAILNRISSSVSRNLQS